MATLPHRFFYQPAALLYAGQKQFVHGINHFTNSRVSQSVENVCAFPAGVHNTALTENGEVAGDGRLRNRQDAGQIANGFLPFAQFLDDYQAFGVGKRLVYFRL